MSNFPKMWLTLVKACPEIGELFTPDSRQEWVCPKCLKNLGTLQDEIYCDCSMARLQPIPRLDQLVGMVKSPCFYLYVSPAYCKFTIDSAVKPVETKADTPEEAVVLGIAHEHGLAWTGEAWERR